MNVGLGTANVKSMQRAGSLKVVASELAKYKMDLVASQDTRWVGAVDSQQMIINFSMEMGGLITTKGQAFFT
jgi:hypothetical protein